MPRRRLAAALLACATSVAALPLAAQSPAAADGGALRAAYRAFESGMHAGSLAAIPALLAPDFEHHGLDRRGSVVVTPRDRFVARLLRPRAATDSVAAFTITITDVVVRGDSAEVAYREFVDVRRAATATTAARRDSSTSWWRDRWVRTPAGWRAVRFVEVAPPAGR